MRSESGFRWRRFAPPVLLATLLALGLLAAGCDGEADGDPRPFGPGSGPPPIVGPPATQTLPGYGSLDYDSGGTPYYTWSFLNPLDPTAKDPAVAMLENSGDGVQLRFIPIAGRPDTPCRFFAALLARDQGYQILGDGEDRINDRGIVFHEVWLTGANVQRLVCAQLTGNAGLMVRGTAPSTGLLQLLQAHYVLNSIRP